MGRLKFTPLARRDLREIKAYIARDNPKAAGQYLQLIRQKCKLLASSPGLGTRRDEYCGLYKFTVRSHLIFYRPVDGGIEVIRILHGARDLESLLGYGAA